MKKGREGGNARQHTQTYTHTHTFISAGAFDVRCDVISEPSIPPEPLSLYAMYMPTAPYVTQKINIMSFNKTSHVYNEDFFEVEADIGAGIGIEREYETSEILNGVMLIMADKRIERKEKWGRTGED